MPGTIFSPKPAIIGHRGSGDATVEGQHENTVGSCLAAVSDGASWIEVDVRRSADDQLVVHHNPTTADGVFVVDQTAAEVEGKGVGRFTDVLAALPADVGVNVDAKSELEDATCAAERTTGSLLAPVLAAECGRRPLLVSSFDPALLLWLREQVPGLQLGLITWVHFPLRHAVPTAAHLDFDAICLHTGSFGENPIEKGPVHRPLEYSVQIAHEAGLEVLAWCPDPEVAIRFGAAHVDAVCVNDVPAVVAALGAR